MNSHLNYVRDDGVKSKLFYAARDTDDFWLFFKHAKTFLDSHNFSELVREFINPGDVEIPESYINLAKLNPRGLVTLNLDRISPQLMARVHPSGYTPRIVGTEIARKWHVLGEENPWLVQIHGNIDDEDSWVLDTDDRTRIRSNAGYDLFLNHLFNNFTVLFVGVNLSDITFSEPLLRLRQNDFKPSRLFWFTNRSPADSSFQWASAHSVHVVRYAASTAHEHAEAISVLVDRINNYQSFDKPKPAPDRSSVHSFNVDLKNTDPDSIALLEPEAVRKTLSTLLSQRISDSDDKDLYDVFMRFVDEYDYAIKTRAFYKSKDSRYSNFFDYKVIFPALGKGNFGEVFQAYGPDDEVLAIKIMHPNIVSAEEMLGGFRRGSASMKILRDRKVEGVSRIIESFEMPPTIVMEYVSGNSLEDLFGILKSFSWRQKLRLLFDIGNIVDACHKLPDFVLHRDIKPSNVMLEGLDYDTYEYDRLVVLDFDMSWHKGSKEKDVVFESRDDFGYLAPEQTDSSLSSLARSTKVDSYGLGMTGFAVLSESHPIPNMPLSDRWEERVRQSCVHGFDEPWTCLPARLTRLILEATKYEQSERLDFSSMTNRLRGIWRFIDQVDFLFEYEIVAEEILSRISEGASYQWNDTRGGGTIEFPNGVRFEIQVDVNKSEYRVKLIYNATGHHQFSKIKDRIGLCREFFSVFLRSDRNRLENSSMAAGLLTVTGAIPFVKTVEELDVAVAALSEGLDYLRRI